MRLRHDIWLVIAISFAAISAAQTVSDHRLGMNITKPWNDNAIQDQRDEIRSLHRQLSELTEANAALQANICSCRKRNLSPHAVFKRPKWLVNNTQADLSFNTHLDLLPLMMGFEKSSTEPPRVDPQRATPNLPVASPLHKGSDLLATVRVKKALGREQMVYWIVLTLATTYVVTIVGVFFKTTADAKLRKQKERSSRNAALDYWKKRHKQERDLKALREERYQLRVRHELRKLKKRKAADADTREHGKNIDAAV